MELGSAPRHGPRAPPAASPSGPSPGCDWGWEPGTRGKPNRLPVPWSQSWMDAPGAGGRGKTAFTFLASSLSWALRAALCFSQPLQSLLSLVRLR